ncbi:MAG: 30S ribosomal protein S3 [Candidatus Woesearchaeota archaeon]
MIEKKFVEQKMKEHQIEEYISSKLKNVGHSHTKLQRTPLGEKIIISTSHPGLVVGRKGDNIKDLTIALKNEFKLENPQLEISEVENPNLDARIVAERIASTLEKFGSNKFKGVGHKTMTDVLNAGALGVEILISGKIPGARAKTWRFYQGYLKKCGDIAITGVKEAKVSAQLKSGTIGVKVRIMPPDIVLPDRIRLRTEQPLTIEEGKKEEIKEVKEVKKPEAKKPRRQRKQVNEKQRTKADAEERA